jgi:Uma2 family endonuclease
MSEPVTVPYKLTHLPDHTQLPDKDDVPTKSLVPLPDHTQLPDKDGVPVMNFQEAPQDRLLSDSIQPILRQLHPDGHYVLGHDSGIYWRLTEPPLSGCKAPDWYYVSGVPPLPAGQHRRSYVLWHEVRRPLVVLEFASGDGSEERDRTPMEGKFWVYEQGICVPYYGIFVFQTGHLEMYHLQDDHYERQSPNERGHFPIPPMRVELGVWHGYYDTVECDWLRWWDADGQLLLTGHERSEQVATDGNEAKAKADRLAAKLRELGVDPNTL